MRFKFLGLHRALLLVGSTCLLVLSPPVFAAERVVLNYGVLSASQDGQVSLIEIIKNYPTNEVEVDGKRLQGAYRQLRRLQTSLQDLFGV